MKTCTRLNRDSNRSTDQKRIRLGLGIVGVVLLVMLVNGCASISGSGEPDQNKYNHDTGYPAVGGPSFGHF